MMASTRRAGVVARLLESKGYGFITGDDGATYYFHRSACPDFSTVTPATRVTFFVVPTVRGPRGQDVRAAS
jgi:cold shock CspA family protein